jgi:hypothetical protein
MGRAALGAWFILMLGVGAALLAKHIVAFRTPAPTAAMGATLGTLRRAPDQGKWFALHVLYAGCRCSERVVDHLTSTKRPTDWAEAVLWVGSDLPPAALEQHGFAIKRLTTAELPLYGIEAAPTLVALDPANSVLYLGGYTERKQGPDIDDLRILADARASKTLAALPVFGCAVSNRLRRAVSLLPVL